MKNTTRFRKIEVYRWLALARALDDALCVENPKWFPAEGEEATIVGAFYDLRPDDAVAPHYRDPFVVYLMRGAELWRLAAQALGKGAGYNKGRSVPFTGPVTLNVIPWVAGDLGSHIGVATGAALAFQQDERDSVCVCSFGDGTSNRGDFHENLNLAANWRLPIVYVCQNNGWAISQPANSYLTVPVVTRATGYGIPGVAVDGTDVAAVRGAVASAVARARKGEGPTLIEAVSQRVRGHSASHTVTDHRHDGSLTVADPLHLYARSLIEHEEAREDELAAIRDVVAMEVAEAITRAKACAEAGEAELGLQEVYA